MKIGFFTSVCEEDKHWIPQYLKELERLEIAFAIHFDRCSDELKKLMREHPLCVASTEQNKLDHVFSEKDKQGVLNGLVDLDYDWAINVDIDETWEKDAPTKIQALEGMTADVVDYKWVCLWNKPDQIRTDGPLSSGHRTRIYNLRSEMRWIFYSDVINGAAAFDRHGQTRLRNETRQGKIDLVCIHWGMMTQEDRLFHKERWDRIYGHYSDRGNPYGFWDWALDEAIEPRIEFYADNLLSQPRE